MKYRSRKNPMTAEERRQYDRDVEAYQARKELERHLDWERYQLREEEEAGGRKKAERRRNPPPTFETCPSYMEYDWWVEHYAPQHVRDAARAQALVEAQRKYAPPPATPSERAQMAREEAAYRRGMRREARIERRNPAPGAIALSLLPYVTKALGDKVTAFNALPVSERKARLRTFLQSKRRWGMGVAGGLAAPQIAKSDMALSAIVHAIERHGSEAVAEGSAAAARHLEKKNPRRRSRR